MYSKHFYHSPNQNCCELESLIQVLNYNEAIVKCRHSKMHLGEVKVPQINSVEMYF